MAAFRFASIFVLALSVCLHAQTVEPAAPLVVVPPPVQTTPQTPQEPPQPSQTSPQNVQPAQASPQPVQPVQESPEPPHASRQKVSEQADKANTEDKNNTENDSPIRAEQIHNPQMWHDPGKISSLDLFYGQGGKDRQPEPPFVFEGEDRKGTNPKFDVHDAKNKKWRVKLGEEVRPEVVASRLMWAMGYYVNDDYVLTSAKVEGLHLQRGGDRVKDGRVTEARFARKPAGQKKIGTWEWRENPFTGTREFDGLRVMMAVMNNWDVKDINNAVYTDKDSNTQIFLTSDIGATFGTNGLSWTRARSKGNVNSFKDSKFIQNVDRMEVDFATPKAPTAFLVKTAGFGAKEYVQRAGYEWIGHNIPREHARWIGSMLGQLSHQQLVDAFRAGHFPPDHIDAYVDVVESRIKALKEL
jgi:hypothetical protein